MALRLPTLHQTAAYSSVKFNTNLQNTQTYSNSIMVSSTSSNTSSASNSSSTNSSCNNSVAHDTQMDQQQSSFKTSLSLFGGNVAANTTPNGSVTISSTSRIHLGLMNNDGKYLTAENFGYKINATGNTLRKKQKWTIEQDNDEFVYLISPLGFYLSTDKYGKLSCEKMRIDGDCRFLLESNNDGKWAFKSVAYGYYFAGNNDQLHCFSKTPEWWTVHLAIHPQINLRHALRKRYARFEDDEIHVDEIIPWGADSLITIEFRDGKYAIRTSNGMYLGKDGKLVEMASNDTVYSIEFCKGCVAFRHDSGKYLTAVGPQGIIVARSKTIAKDELFVLDSSRTQISLVAHNGKHISVKQGIDVSANQIERNDTETFQLEEDSSNEKWSFRTNTNKYWKLESTNGIQASAGDSKHENTHFEMIWAKPGHVVLRAANGKYVSAAATGHIKALDDCVTEADIFRLSLVNRPILVLKCDFGFIGYKNKSGYKLESNRSTFNVILLEEALDRSGFYHLKGSHGSYWDVGADNNLYVNNKNPTKFSIELMPNNRMLIKAPNGCYLKGEQNGNITANGESTRQATQWEY